MQVLKKPTRWSQWEEDDGELPELPWKKTTSCAAPPDLDDENHAQAAYMAPVAASPPMMKPKSYATVAKASVVAAARPQPAAVPKRRVAASMPPAHLKPSATACTLAADKVTHAYGNTHECVLLPSCCYTYRNLTISSSPRRQPRTRPSSALRETRCEIHDGIPTAHIHAGSCTSALHTAPAQPLQPSLSSRSGALRSPSGRISLS